ncbi:MAG TPA: SDR family NAD(P)-dependent oxidoreductase [Opitutus sp.]|nr:SDR family NAD(P)-dependent oxidoreductase [Opitutus sp.]
MSRPLSELYATAFVTGTSAGLGRAFAEMLLAEGVRVWGTARDAGRLTDLASRYPALFTPVILDLAVPAAAETAFERAANTAGGAFDLVVNNAGYGVFGEFDATDFSVWQTQLDTMIGTTLRLAHAALRRMRRKNAGCLVNVSSLAVEFPLPFMSGYNVAKAALSAFSESLWIETRGTGISVIDFRPGDFRTDFNQSMQAASSSPPLPSARTQRAWQALENHLRGAPPAARAAADLKRALRLRRHGTVRSGMVFQAAIAPFFARFLPAALRRAVSARYFGL